MTIDRGFTHVAILVGDLDRSIAFYAKYARMEVVHQRQDGASGTRVAWLSDKTRPFVIVCVELPRTIPRFLLRAAKKLLFSFEHLGVGCASREEVDRLAAEAAREGCLRRPPTDSGPPVGYWCFLADPDGNSLELAYGQEVGLVVATA